MVRFELRHRIITVGEFKLACDVASVTMSFAELVILYYFSCLGRVFLRHYFVGCSLKSCMATGRKASM